MDVSTQQDISHAARATTGPTLHDRIFIMCHRRATRDSRLARRMCERSGDYAAPNTPSPLPAALEHNELLSRHHPSDDPEPLPPPRGGPAAGTTRPGHHLRRCRLAPLRAAPRPADRAGPTPAATEHRASCSGTKRSSMPRSCKQVQRRRVGGRGEVVGRTTDTGAYLPGA